MDLNPYIESIHRQLAAAAEAGGEDARALADRLAPSLDAAVRLALLEALAAAADDITCELAPGSVELRLRGREPEFVVTAPPAPTDEDADGEQQAARIAPDSEERAMARINLRMPERLKVRVEAAAAGEGLSVNAWLVRVAAAAAERAGADRPRAPQGKQQYRRWAR
jgi:uncharacterized protein (DUF1778 family)